MGEYGREEGHVLGKRSKDRFCRAGQLVERERESGLAVLVRKRGTVRKWEEGGFFKRKRENKAVESRAVCEGEAEFTESTQT